MNIILGNDHSSTKLKLEIKKYIEELGHTIYDVGTNDYERVDYYYYGEKAQEKFIDIKADRLIVFCGTGVGIGVSVSKAGGECILVNSVASVIKSKKTLKSKQFSIGARVTTLEIAKMIVDEILK